MSFFFFGIMSPPAAKIDRCILGSSLGKSEEWMTEFRKIPALFPWTKQAFKIHTVCSCTIHPSIYASLMFIRFPEKFVLSPAHSMMKKNKVSGFIYSISETSESYMKVKMLQKMTVKHTAFHFLIIEICYTLRRQLSTE